MAKVQNPVGERFSIALRQHSSQRAKLMEAATSGLKSDLSVVDAILGAKVKSAADMAKKVINSMETGFNVSEVTLNVLRNFRERFENIKRDISTLNNADDATLIDAQINFQNDVGSIISTLRTSEFAGKRLFDGSLAAATTATIPDTGMTVATSSPYKIQSDISSASNIIISVQKLLSGDASSANGQDPVTNAAFNPLFKLHGVGTVPPLAAAAAHAIQQVLTVGGGNQNAVNNVAVGADPTSVAVKAAAVKAGTDAIAAGIVDGSTQFKTIVLNATVDTAAKLSAGDLTTDTGRTAIIQGMDAKITTLDSIIARITGAADSLAEAQKNLEILMPALYDASNNYSSANYEDVIEQLVLLLREDKVASLIFALSERAINAILNQLESAAAAA